MTQLWQHPFKTGVQGLLERHFAPEITKRFVLIFEGQLYDKWANKNIWKQLKDDVPILEVRYMTGDESSEYICDVFPYESRQKTEHRLLQYITDKVKSGKIGKDWTEKDGKISLDVSSGKYETPDEV